MQIPDLLDAATYASVLLTRRSARYAARLRSGGIRSAGGGFQAITKHADVVAVSRDSALFSSAQKGYMPTPEPDALALEQTRLMLLGMDPPDHTRLRGLVNRGFTPRRVAQLEPRIRSLCRDIVDAALARGTCDFVADVAGELPSSLIAELVGIPLADGRKLYELTEAMHSAGNPKRPGGRRDVRVLGGRASREADAAGRSRERAARGGDRRREAQRSRVRPVLSAADQRGRRHHAQSRGFRDACADGASRAARRAAQHRPLL